MNCKPQIRPYPFERTDNLVLHLNQGFCGLINSSQNGQHGVELFVVVSESRTYNRFTQPR